MNQPVEFRVQIRMAGQESRIGECNEKRWIVDFHFLEFSEFELADRDELARLASSHPRHAALITRLGKA